MNPPFRKLLVANRGEIAVRIIRAARELGINTVAVYSKADEGALHVKLAHESVCIGSAFSKDSYLNAMAIMSAATLTGCDALHPGYGFLSEKTILPELCEKFGIAFIGPKAEVIKMLGDKDEAKTIARSIGIPTVPGSNNPVETYQEGLELANQIGFPVIIKACAGGGGRGMRIVYEKSSFKEQFLNAQQEALTSFGDGSLLVEKYISKAKHIEVQILGASDGSVIHFGLRECSIQRRFQKIIEEALPPTLTKDILEKISNDAIKLAKKINYTSLGTVEFIFDCDERKHYFLEVNTRIQVEHPVTEEITGMDLVKLQILNSCEKSLKIKQSDIKFQGHAIEARVNAEDPVNQLPQSGRIEFFHQPSGFRVRVDSFVYSGCVIPPYYDSLIAKVICWGRDREESIHKLISALTEMVVVGIPTNQEFLKEILLSQEFQDGTYTTKFIEQLQK